MRVLKCYKNGRLRTMKRTIIRSTTGHNRKSVFPKSADAILDRSFSAIGIAPEAIEYFLKSHKKGARIAANSLSLARIVLGEVTVRQYENAYKKKNIKKMSLAAVVLGFLLTSDFIDGYIARKAHIQNNKSGKILDSAADVYLKARIISSSISESSDALDKVRGVGELLVAMSAVPDVFKGKYESTTEGKLKTWADSGTAVARVARQILETKQKKNSDSSIQQTLKILEDTARIVGIGLALTDGIKRNKGIF